MPLPIYKIVFFIFAAMLISSALMVVVSRNPVRSILFLVLSFFCAAVLWMMIQAEFLSLVLIFVYVGAVMTLFLFVVMMLQIDEAVLKEGFVRYLPYGFLAMVLLVAMMLMVIGPEHLSSAMSLPVVHDVNYSNTKTMGTLLFTDYVYPFEIAALILLVAIIAAIALAFHGRKPNAKSQNVMKQLSAKKSDRLRVVDIKADES